MRNCIKIWLPLLIVACAGMGVAMYYVFNPKLNPGESGVFNQVTDADSLMVDNRHYGYVNYDKFVALAASARNLNGRFDRVRDVREKGDSVFFKVNNPSLFYGKDDGRFWKERYMNNPVSITDSGFTAKVEMIDTVKYIYIPYQILTSVANFVECNN